MEGDATGVFDASEAIRSATGTRLLRFDRSAAAPGTALALMAITLVALIAFLALAIDIGMLAIARTQAQNAADVACLTAARTVNGDSSTTYNFSNATTNAQSILTYNRILNQSVGSSQLSLNYGTYDYNQGTQSFNANFPATSGVPYTAISATVTASSLPSGFSRVFGQSFLPSVSATSTAVHRPRDVALVMDLSGSMRFGTCNGFDFYTSSRTGNNPDSAVPTFGAYSSSSASMQGPTTDQTSGLDSYTIPGSNVTVGNASYTKTFVTNFFQNDAYATTLIRAFDSYSSTDGGLTWKAPTTQMPQLPPAGYTSTPGGDVPLFKKGSTTTYAKTVGEAVNSSGTARNALWELDGYGGCSNGTFNNTDTGSSTYPTSGAGSFVGYTQGPNYYGKTFFVWPPDPRQPLSTSGASWTLASGLSGAGDSSAITAFLTDFGYTSIDFNDTCASTTLSAKAISTATSISVSATTGFPTAAPFKIRINSEVMSVTAVSGKTWTVSRAVGGTSAATQSNGSTVTLLTSPALYGIVSTTLVSGSQAWPWPNDSGAPSSAATSPATFHLPGGSRLLKTTDAVYQKILRLYGWNYVVDNVGTTPCDWRIRFFGTNDNTRLFNSTTGEMNSPGASTYTINYKEILRWIASGSNPFPKQLRSGRIKYYGAIPTSITGTWPNYGGTDQRFWVEFIDYCLGFRQTSAGNYSDISNQSGYGTDFSWGTVSRSSPPLSSPYQAMGYSDNPARPRLRFWFGPLMMADMMNNYNMDCNFSGYFQMQPGNSYEAPLYVGKEAFLAAVDTMKTNHANDWVTVACYSWPRSSTSDTDDSKRFNCVSCPLGTNYDYAKSALAFPFSTIKADGSCNNTEITPYDADPSTSAVPSLNFVNVPRAGGDTCFAMGLMLCYNQFAVTPTNDSVLRTYVTSSPVTFPTGMAGGMGRKGAQKLVIFETDGQPNCTATASLVNAGNYSYYQIRYDMNKPYTSEYPV